MSPPGCEWAVGPERPKGLCCVDDLRWLFSLLGLDTRYFCLWPALLPPLSFGALVKLGGDKLLLKSIFSFRGPRSAHLGLSNLWVPLNCKKKNLKVVPKYHEKRNRFKPPRVWCLSRD